MRVLLAGASGFLGTRLIDRLRADGHETVQLVRREPANAQQVRWNPATGSFDRALLSTVDAVVNLAGAGVGDKRWTEDYKQTLVESRVRPTAVLAEALAAAPNGPRVLLNASAVGWYGDRGDTPVDEQAPAGQGFMADLCRQWEAATEPAEQAGVRVVRMRTGLPLHPDGGLLKPLLLQFKLFAGGRMGSGKQFVPWISMPDWLGAVSFLLERDIAGPVNLTGPEPVRNAELAAELGRRLHRPSRLPVPGFALKAAAGGLGNEALVSQRVLPAVLTEAGYPFGERTIGAALGTTLKV